MRFFFAHQDDPPANRMAAFPPRDREAFMAHWGKILRDPAVTTKTVLFRGAVAGSIVSFPRSGKREVGYWIGRHFWGQGVATAALSRFLACVRERPLWARVAKRNPASLRVLEKCGFAVRAEDKYSNALGEEIEELVLELGGPPL